MTCSTSDALNLLMKGSEAFLRIQQNGIRIDLPYCEHQHRILGRNIERAEKSLLEFEEIKIWRNKYKDKFNLGSTKQLADILYNEFKYTPPKMTEKGNPSLDAESLDTIDIPMVKHLVSIRKMEKMRNTYLASIIRETVDGYLHPFFQLHLVRTFRSSSSEPNFQNLPIRDKEMGKIIRKALRPRKGRRLLGADYGKIEVHGAAWYHKDPVMLQYLNDPTKDMHRDMAAEIYCVTADLVSKDMRYSAKNGFVFPQFYGDYWKSCAKGLWDNITTLKLVTKEGIPVKDVLKKTKITWTYWDREARVERKKTSYITNLEAFEQHVKQVEDRFWNQTFTRFTEWKEEQYDFYLKHGYVDLITGFRCHGPMSKNQALNVPVQGPAFHCMLWSCIELIVNERIKQEGLTGLVVGQIHDELVADVPDEEVEDFVLLLNQVMTKDIREAWPFIITPIDIEVKVTEVDGNWFETKGFPIPTAIRR